MTTTFYFTLVSTNKYCAPGRQAFENAMKYPDNRYTKARCVGVALLAYFVDLARAEANAKSGYKKNVGNYQMKACFEYLAVFSCGRLWDGLLSFKIAIR